MALEFEPMIKEALMVLTGEGRSMELMPTPAVEGDLLARVQELAQLGVKHVVGPYTSTEALAVCTWALEHAPSMKFVLPVATSDKLAGMRNVEMLRLPNSRMTSILTLMLGELDALQGMVIVVDEGDVFGEDFLPPDLGASNSTALVFSEPFDVDSLLDELVRLVVDQPKAGIVLVTFRWQQLLAKLHTRPLLLRHPFFGTDQMAFEPFLDHPHAVDNARQVYLPA